MYDFLISFSFSFVAKKQKNKRIETGEIKLNYICFIIIIIDVSSFLLFSGIQPYWSIIDTRESNQR